MSKFNLVLLFLVASGLLLPGTADAQCERVAFACDTDTFSPRAVCGCEQVSTGLDVRVLPNVIRPDNFVINAMRNAAGGITGMMTTATDGALPQVAAVPDSRMRTWVDFVHNSVDSNHTGSRYDAQAVALMSGLEYQLPGGMTLAATFAREDLDVDGAAAFGANLDGRGYTFAPYLLMSFAEHWQVSVMGGYSWLDYDIRGATGDPDGKRLFGSAGVTGDFEVGTGMHLSPEAYIWYAEQATDGYTNGFVPIRSDRSDFGRFSFGGSLGYPIEIGSGRVEPYVRALGELDFDDDDRVTLTTGQTFSRDDFGVVAGAGFNAALTNDLSARLEWTWDSIGRDDLDAWTFRGHFQLRF